MSTRLDYYKISPDAIKPMVALEGYLHKCGLEKSLLEPTPLCLMA